MEELWTEDRDDWRIEVTSSARSSALEMISKKPKEIIAAWQLEPLEVHIQSATDLLSTPENRRAVERIANELIARRTFQYGDVDLLIDLSDGEISEAEYETYRRFRGRT